MNTFLFILLLISGAGNAYLVYLYKGAIKDEDRDFIPDAVEGKVEKAKATAKKVKSKTKKTITKAKSIKDRVVEVFRKITGK